MRFSDNVILQQAIWFLTKQEYYTSLPLNWYDICYLISISHTGQSQYQIREQLMEFIKVL